MTKSELLSVTARGQSLYVKTLLQFETYKDDTRDVRAHIFLMAVDP